MSLIAVQHWPMPEKTIRGSMDDMCICGHRRHMHRSYVSGEKECVDCEQDPRDLHSRCMMFRSREPEWTEKWSAEDLEKMRDQMLLESGKFRPR